MYRDDVAAAAAAAGAAGGAAGGGGDGVQLLFRSTADTLVSFIMQSWPQLPPALQAVLHDRGAAAAATAAASQLQQQRQQEQQQVRPLAHCSCSTRAQLPPVCMKMSVPMTPSASLQNRLVPDRRRLL